ncbi:MAG: HAMP domain-containing sensor histidine kinase [Gammaproteobacteria bacterium]
MHTSSSRSKRVFPWATVLLLASLALVSVLAWQAYQVTRLQSLAAENVLRDYARLNADELARRSVGGIFFYGLIPLQNMLTRDELTDVTVWRSTVQQIRSAANPDERTSRALTLVMQFLYFDTASGELHGETELPGSIETALTERLTRAPEESDEDDDPIYLETVYNNGAHMFYMTPVVTEQQVTGFVGLQIENGSLAAWFGEALSRGPLLPTLMDGEFGNSDLVIRVTDLAGAELMLQGEFEPDGIVVSKSLGDVYDDVFSGMQLQLSIPSDIAPKLIIGGLPGERLPMLVLLIVVTFTLLILAGVQFYRERRLTELRKDFVSQVSHELRTPLTQIRMFTETLRLDRVRNEKEKTDALDIIDREARRLTHLVENILQFSRNERGSTHMALDVQDLIPLMRDVCDEFSRMHPSTRLEFTAPAGLHAAANVDADAMRQVLLNLLDNSAKYGTTECLIQIRINVNEDQVRIVVDDNGPGIPGPERDRVWNGFYRLPRERDSATAGTGIGLAVVKELVLQQGGTVVIGDSDAGGARFTIVMPNANWTDS